MKKSFFKHSNLDFLYKVLGMQLKDVSSYPLEKKEHKMPKGSKIFTVINLSYLTREFHCTVTPDIIERYMSLFSHNIFFFEESKFEMFSNKKREERNEDNEDRDASSEGPDEYLDTEVNNVVDNFLDPNFYNTISNGLIKVNTNNRFLTLVFTTLKDIAFKRVDYKDKLNKEDYISTIGMNTIKSSSSVSILDIDSLDLLKLSEARIFLQPNKKISFDKDIHATVEKYYKDIESEVYTSNYILQKCEENYNAIYGWGMKLDFLEKQTEHMVSAIQVLPFLTKR